MKQYLLAAIASIMLVGFVVAEEFNMTITAIAEDGTATGTKWVPRAVESQFVRGTKVTVKLAKDVKVHKGKFNMEPKGFVADGDDLKMAGLKTALMEAQNGSAVVAGKSISDKDTLEITLRDGKPSARLNGKDVAFNEVTLQKGKVGVSARVTTGDDGVATTVLITNRPVGDIGEFKKKDIGEFKKKAKTDK